VNAKDKYSNTPLSLTAAKGEVELVHFLLHQGSLVNKVDQDGRTALWHAAIASWTDITQVSTSSVFLYLMTFNKAGLHTSVAALDHYLGLEELNAYSLMMQTYTAHLTCSCVSIESASVLCSACACATAWMLHFPVQCADL